MSTKETNNERQILEAAEEIFLEKGYNMAKTTEIAKKAGVTHAMLHYYFRTKENLFDKIFEKKAELISNIFFLQLGKDAPFLERLANAIEKHFDLLVDNPKLPGFLLFEILNNESRKMRFLNSIKPKATSIIKRLQEEIDNEVLKGNVRPYKAYDLIYSIMSLNMTAFLMAPVIQTIRNMSDQRYNLFLQERKKLNIEVLLSQLKV